MKPTYLELCAFGPFAEQVVLPLERIVSEGVFLIHGATGAGKTTIFDAVSFALFGNASGENRPTDSFRSDFAKPDSKTYVILEFTHGGNCYKIERSPAYRRLKQRGDGYTDSKAEAVLTLPDGRKIVGYQMVTDKIIEILGVDWKQFKQISMLAQGEFLKLLTVESRERGDIFRKVFHTDELGRVGRDLKDRMLKLKRFCEETEAAIVQYYRGIDNSADSGYQEQIEEFFETGDIHKTTEFQQILAELTASDKKMLVAAKEKLEQTEQQLTEFRVKQSKVAEWLEKQNEFRKLEEQLPAMLSMEQKNRQDKKRLEMAKRAVNMVKPKQEAYLLAREECRTLLKTIAEKEQKLEELRIQEEEITLFYQKAQADRRRQEQQLRKLEQLRNELKQLVQKEELERKYQAQEKELSALCLQEQEKKEQIKQFGERLKECRGRQDRLTEIYQTGRALEAQERELKAELAELDGQTKRLENLETVRNAYERLTGQISSLLEEKQQKNEKLQQMEAAYTCEQAGMLAMELTPDSPCPVCGSRQHPNPARPSGILTTKEELGKQKKEYEELCNRIEQLGREAASEKGTMELLLLQLGIQAEGEAWNRRLNERLERRQTVQDTLTELEKRLDELVKEQEEGMRAKEEAAVLEKKNEEERSGLEALSETIQRIRMEQETASRSIKQIMLEASFATAGEAEAALKEAVAEQEAKKQEIAKAEENYLNWNNRRQSEQAVLQQLSGQKLVRMQKEQLAGEDYGTAIRLAGFADEADCEKNMLPAVELQALEEETLHCESRLIRFRERYDVLKQELERKVPEPDTDLEENISQLSNEKGSLTNQITRLSARIETNEKVRSNVETQLFVLTDMQKEYSAVSLLSNVANGELSGKDRLPFEQYVQAFYFEQVIYEANLRLKKMSGGRYLLQRRTEAENRRSVTGLDLEIMDFFTGKARSVKSLSGGESFKAALSLALGLSDAIQGRTGGVVVETMFVDEGFGSLDKDSLEQAVGILKELAEDNRIVGIISHVEELKECIDKKILLTKTTQGSRISWDE